MQGTATRKGGERTTGTQQMGKAGPLMPHGGTWASQERVLEKQNHNTLWGRPQAQEEEEKEEEVEVAGEGRRRLPGPGGWGGLQQSRHRGQRVGPWPLTCRLVSCCCWCAMVCFTSTLLMLCSMAYFLACGRRW